MTTRKSKGMENFCKGQLKISSTLYTSPELCAHLPLQFLCDTGNKKHVCQQEKDQFRRVQVGTMERRGQMLRKEMAVETVNEWLLETLGRCCIEMLTRP